MTKLSFAKFYFDDFLEATEHFSFEQKGVYLEMLARAWTPQPTAGNGSSSQILLRWLHV